MNLLFNFSFGFYLLSFLLTVATVLRNGGRLEKAAEGIYYAGAMSLTIFIAGRWYTSGQPPFANIFESLVCFAWAVTPGYLMLRRSLNRLDALPFAAFASTAIMAIASLQEDAVSPLVPILRDSFWLTTHVLLCFLGYAALTLAAALALRLLAESIRPLTLEVRLRLDKGCLTLLRGGVTFLGLGIITGSIWAEQAWGAYWQWDPKETAALATWLIFILVLHLRRPGKPAGKILNLLIVTGLMAVIFTYIGVNYIGGLHAYQ